MSEETYVERPGAVKFRGKPVTLVGKELAVGDKALDFTLITNGMAAVTLNDVLAGGTRAALIIVVPSIDTSVCSLETVKFNRHVADLPTDQLVTYTVSVDLPFAQKRWCSSERVSNLSLLSAYRDPDFGPAYGVLIKELGLLTRAVFLIDKEGTIRLTSVMPEVALEPDYDDILRQARELIGA
ncbi:MAG: thiol peroxidase [Capsulimonadaceae bacterium]|nr:thiol peroxidase [Capsulimonadaceae bacterium]